MRELPANAVVVTLEFQRGFAKAKISFSGPRDDHGVLAAKAQMVRGVRTALTTLGSSQELEFYLTDFFSQTQRAALSIVEAVLLRLGLTVIGDIHIEDDSDKPAKGKKNKKAKIKKK